jgi:hypothetical protein
MLCTGKVQGIFCLYLSAISRQKHSKRFRAYSKRMKRFYRQLTADILISLTVFLISLTIRKDPFHEGLITFVPPAFCFYGFHIIISLVYGKFEYEKKNTLAQLSRLYNQSWLTSGGIALLVLVIFRIGWISRQMILTNLFGLLAGEYLFILLVSLFRESVALREPEEIISQKVISSFTGYPKPGKKTLQREVPSGMSILQTAEEDIRDFVGHYCQSPFEECLVLDTPDSDTLLSFPEGRYRNIINVRQLNRIRDINRFLEVANIRLQEGGVLIICAETKDQRKVRIMRKYPPVLNRLYYLGDYLLMRVIPKLAPFRQIWLSLTKGQSQVLSRPEILGRLCASGFSIAEEMKSERKFCVAGLKTGHPLKNNYATYGFLIYLRRIGKDGNMIKIFKLRTMHPYSEYIQDYVYKNNKLANGGKIMDDFRVTTLGKFLRRYWIDELPSLWNWLRGDVKIVGVRPLSKHYYSLYTPELRQKRIQFKPGLIPPFYTDLPGSLEEIMASELRYLERYEKAPLKTDFIYFWKAIRNIVFKGAKSG